MKPNAGPALDFRGIVIFAAVVTAGLAAGVVALVIGARHFERAEV